MADPKNCKLTLYVNEPYGGGPEQWGHVYISLTDAQGVERFYGFHADSFMFGKDNVPKEDQIDGLKDSFKRVSGHIVDDSGYNFTEKETYAISQADHDKAQELVKKWQKSPPKYVLATNNCVTFLMKVCRAAGVTPPAQIYLVPTPKGTAQAIRIARKLREMKDKLDGADKKIIGILADAPANDQPAFKPDAAPKLKLPGLFLR